VNEDLVQQRPEGLYCPPGRFFIDPWRPVDRAVITHAHADHARRGHGAYLATAVSAGVLRARLGEGIALQGVAYGETVVIDGVRVSLHPAGHVLGSAQVRIEHRGRVWVVSGDYYLSAHDDDDDADPRRRTCEPFEPVRCECFVTESTFGLPVYRWRRRAEVFAEIDAWWRANAEAGRASLLMGYSFGKAQRLLAGVDAGIGPIVVHGAVEPLNEAYRAAGVALPETTTLEALRRGARKTGAARASQRAGLARSLVIAPPAVAGSAWAATLGDYGDAFASGWMQLRGARRRYGVDRGFVLSDHADWPGLQRAIAATGAHRVIVTHGYEAVTVRWLTEQGLEAGSFRTEFGDDGIEATADAPVEGPADVPAEVHTEAPAEAATEATTEAPATPAADSPSGPARGVRRPDDPRDPDAPLRDAVPAA
jgi:putative mRNA 3-end processing factor